ncbi:hypothetical protein N0V93_008833 [Gnomoniopsis smithogilvyi]|uniref:Solute carrier family 40 member n=1 Tax=Gnomoniopsis smithogilvyi TaxID=1191159 RepID=A0A9W8YNG5_9PEZI|nr:hypothetical protein N0V93_008833 [Gnomoniopsis smithogilvyi]
MAPTHEPVQSEPPEAPATEPVSSDPTTHDTDLAAVGLLPQSAEVSYTATTPMTDAERATGITAGHHLLHQLENGNEEANVLDTGAEVSNSIAFRLYTSHFLSTWNSRLFEFGAALFLTSIFPGTLLPVSVYSLVRNAGYIIFAQPLGAWMNKGNRLNIIRTSIVGQRVPVAASCALLLVLELKGSALGYRKDDGIFAVIVLLAVVEKLCSTMNTISVERDWVVVITEGNEVARRKMNARMRRIDLFCKLMGPLTISLVAIASTEIAIYTTLGMNVASVLIEYVFIEQVYRRVRGLERANESAIAPGGDEHDRNAAERIGRDGRARLGPKTLLKRTLNNILPIESLPFYYKHPAFLASFALSLLYFTVLSFSGQMITYLISVGYTSYFVGIARVGSSIFEISATWAAPFLMKKIGVVRAGIWSLSWQMACLAGALGWYFSDFQGQGTNSIFSATGLAVGVALSRMGLWGYDLSAQNIIQDA